LAAPDSLCARAADFHHANDYYQYTTGSCSGAASGAASGSVGLLTAQERQELNLPPLAAPPAAATTVPETGACKDASHVLWHGPVADQAACCAQCAAAPSCVGWTHQYRDPEGQNTSSCFTCNGTRGGPTPGRTSGCVGPACNLDSGAPTDLWSGANPAHSLKPPASCAAQTTNLTAPWPANTSCVYEDALFESEVRRIIAAHPLPQPLFLFWAPHIVHGAASVASFLAAVVTEIYLCNVCSYKEILRRNGRG
jgi:hypothetical protein